MYSKPQQTSDCTDMAWKMFLVLALFSGMSLIPEVAYAGGEFGSVTTVLCNLVQFMTGATGKALATLAIIIVGVGALMGKVSWGMAIIVALGVAVIFGAPSLVNKMASGAGPGDVTCAVGG